MFALFLLYDFETDIQFATPLIMLTYGSTLSSLAVSSANREKLRGSAVLGVLAATLVSEQAAVLLPALEATDSLCLDGRSPSLWFARSYTENSSLILFMSVLY